MSTTLAPIPCDEPKLIKPNKYKLKKSKTLNPSSSSKKCKKKSKKKVFKPRKHKLPLQKSSSTTPTVPSSSKKRRKKTQLKRCKTTRHHNHKRRNTFHPSKRKNRPKTHRHKRTKSKTECTYTTLLSLDKEIDTLSERINGLITIDIKKNNKKISSLIHDLLTKVNTKEQILRNNKFLKLAMLSERFNSKKIVDINVDFFNYYKINIDFYMSNSDHGNAKKYADMIYDNDGYAGHCDMYDWELLANIYFQYYNLCKYEKITNEKDSNRSKQRCRQCLMRMYEQDVDTEYLNGITLLIVVLITFKEYNYAKGFINTLLNQKYFMDSMQLYDNMPFIEEVVATLNLCQKEWKEASHWVKRIYERYGVKSFA